MSTFIIETIEQPTRYWHEANSIALSGWVDSRQLATEFSQETRDNKNFFLPSRGCWVVVSEPKPERFRFALLKLRPVVIKLEAMDGDFDAMNEQYLEFEGAVRQFIAKQQILTAPEWAVDVIESEE